MAIFSNNDSKHQNSETGTTIITFGSNINGEISLECNLYIDGTIEGVIRSSKEITVGNNGKILGEVHTQKLTVHGKVDGNIYADVVNIKPKGFISGMIESSQLIIEPNGFFEGNSKKKETAPAEVQKVDLSLS